MNSHLILLMKNILIKILIEINALYRFSHIFQEILHPNFIQNGQYADVIAFIIYLFDTVIHYLGEIDLRHGFTKREFYIRRICYEVKNRCFWQDSTRWDFDYG